MQTKEELLQYLKNNYKNPGNALYHAGINKINFFFKGKVPINDIEDFLQRNHSYTSNKKPQINFTHLQLPKPRVKKENLNFPALCPYLSLLNQKQNSKKSLGPKVRENSKFPFVVVGFGTLNTKALYLSEL